MLEYWVLLFSFFFVSYIHFMGIGERREFGMGGDGTGPIFLYSFFVAPESSGNRGVGPSIIQWETTVGATKAMCLSGKKQDLLPNITTHFISWPGPRGRGTGCKMNLYSLNPESPDRLSYIPIRKEEEKRRRKERGIRVGEPWGCSTRSRPHFYLKNHPKNGIIQGWFFTIKTG